MDNNNVKDSREITIEEVLGKVVFCFRKGDEYI